MTSGVSVFMERKPLHVAPATRDLGGDGDGDPDMGTLVLCWWHSLAPVQPLSGMVKPLISPVPHLSLGKAPAGALCGDAGNARLGNSPMTPCAEHLRCSR